MYTFTTDEMITNEAGGKQSRSNGRADLIPPKALMEIAKVLGEGAVKYGDWNWKLIPINEHINHALIHMYAHLAGDTKETHLANAICRMMFALELLNEHDNKLDSHEQTYLELGE